MNTTTTPRENCNGHSVELDDAWILHKGNKVAGCILVSHELGWELRLTVGELLRPQVCRPSEALLNTHQAWKAAMIGVTRTVKGRLKAPTRSIR
jgi:hypothetical protein